MVEAVFLQIPPSIRKALWVCDVNHRDHTVYVEHVLLHSFVLLLLNLMSLSWHRSHICYQTSSPCASAGPAQRYPCLHPGCRSIYWGTCGDWQRYESAYWPHHTAQGRHPHQTARVCTSLPLLDQST